MIWLRLLERIHGHLAWLSVAALAHPAILLGRPRRRAGTTVIAATALVVATGLIGGWIYPGYRRHVKPGIASTYPAIALLFERKEHLAVGAVSFALAGCALHLSWTMLEDGDARRRARRLAQGSFIVAAALAAIVAGLGVAVASYASF